MKDSIYKNIMFILKNLQLPKTIDDPMRWQKQQRDDVKDLGFRDEI